MNKTILVSVIAMIALMQFSAVLAASSLDLETYCLEANGVGVSPDQVIAGFAGETMALKFAFISNESVHDARVKVELLGYRDDITAKTEMFVILPGSIYSKSLSLNLPSDVDLSEDYILRVSIFSQDNEFTQDYTVRMQRESYKIDVLSIDSDNEVEAGSNLAVDIVLKNRGFERLDDVYVVARIAELGIEKRAYFEDLMAEDTENDNVDRRDSTERRLFLKLPASAEEGVYDLEVIAYNSDTEARATQRISVVTVEAITDVMTSVTSREIASGETKTYDLIIINKGKSLGVYTIEPETTENLVVSVEDSVVTVPADSSKTVRITVKAGSQEGTYNFGVNVKSGTEVVKRVPLTATVVKSQTSSITGSNITALTVVLAIVFVVLLIVLIVLLTRKPAKSEELEESYY